MGGNSSADWEPFGKKAQTDTRRPEGAEGLIKNHRDEVYIVFRGQNEIMRPSTEGSRKGALDTKFVVDQLSTFISMENLNT